MSMVLEYCMDTDEDSYLSLPKDEPKSNWEVWLLNTKTHLAVIASKEGLDDVIPDDGTFLSGMLICSGLSEADAKDKVDELGIALNLNEDIGPDSESELSS